MKAWIRPIEAGEAAAAGAAGGALALALWKSGAGIGDLLNFTGTMLAAFIAVRAAIWQADRSRLKDELEDLELIKEAIREIVSAFTPSQVETETLSDLHGAPASLAKHMHILEKRCEVARDIALQFEEEARSAKLPTFRQKRIVRMLQMVLDRYNQTFEFQHAQYRDPSRDEPNRSTTFRMLMTFENRRVLEAAELALRALDGAVVPRDLVHI